jgi:hypothetical protein
MDSSSIILLVLLIVVAAVVVIAIARYVREKRSQHLRDKFGPEYARVAQETGSRRAAEKRLEEREKRAQAFTITPLSTEDRLRFTAQWQLIQAQFVDNPKTALADADELLGSVMAARGYPVQDFDQRVADLSVDHPRVVQHYRAAHGIALRHRRGEANTEDMRQAMLHYRSLFEELVSEPSRAHAAE